MAEPKIKPVKRVAGKSKFRLPERTPRPVEDNPLKDILREAKAQEDALAAEQTAAPTTPVKKIAGVRRSPSLPLPQQRVTGTPAKQIAGVSADLSAGRAAGLSSPPETFAEFSRRWSPILRSGQMSVCRALFEMTHAVGASECFTSMPKLAEAAGLKERQCYNVVAQLEVFGFVERPDIFNTPTQKGTVFRLHLEPRPPSARAERRYHIGGSSGDAPSE
jgi:hypothetical protein